MIQRGITASALLSDLYEGKKKNVPIGKTPLTNTFAQNSPDVYPRTAGEDLVTRTIADFEVVGEEFNTKALKRNDVTNEIEFSNATIVNEGKIEAIDFNPESGTLSVIKANGHILQISGFLTQSDFGVGPAGPCGFRGNDGQPGIDGDDGDEGDTGCVGETGPKGNTGNPGPDGKDGAMGIAGPIGEQGLDGLQGPVGKQGRFGHEGARGRKGPNCSPDSVGPPGAPATPVNPSVVISTTPPADNSALLWGKPE